MTTTTAPAAQRTFRFATWRNLGLTVLAAVVLATLGNRAYNLHVHEPLLRDVPVYVVGALLAGAISALVLLRAHRGRAPAAGLGGAVGIAVLGILAFPVTYYVPLAFVWGTTSFLLSKDADPGRLATAARVLGIIALVLTPIVIVLRLVGVTYQVGG